MVLISKKFDFTVELVELQRKAKSYKEERDKLNLIAKDLHRKRDLLNIKVGKLLNLAQQEKKSRDKFNKHVKLVKKEKDVIKVELKKYQMNVNKIKNNMDKIPQKELNRIMKIRKQIKRLEWKYQTNVIPANEEKMIVDQIENMEKELIDKKDLLNQLNEFEDKINQIKEIERRIKEKQKLIISLAEKSQIHHERMVNIYNEIDTEIRPEADKTHQKLLEIRKIADDNHNNLIITLPRIKYLRNKLIKKRNDINKLSNVVETRIKKALEKMKDGKRLTLDEFQLLVKSGLL